MFGNPDDKLLGEDPDRKVHIFIACLHKLCNMGMLVCDTANITQLGSGSKRCWCCKLKYQPEEGLNMRYEDGGDALWMCTRCASKQKVNNNNKSDIATGTNAQLVKRLSQL